MRSPSRFPVLRPAAVVLVAMSVLLLLPACAARHGGSGDALAKKGDWEGAVAAYRAAYREHPSNALADRIEKAETELAAVYVKRGLQALEAGNTGDAGHWWSRALALRPDDRGAGSAHAVVAKHATELERFADAATKDGRFEDAFHAYEPLMAVHPDRFDLQEKNETAHKAFAARLGKEADALAEAGLEGAALATCLRALKHDPLHPTAFARSSDLRKRLYSRARVRIDEPTIVSPERARDRAGHFVFEQALTRPLDGRLGSFPPYGPTKDKNALEGELVVQVEDFAWWDETSYGLDEQRLDVEAAEGGDAVPNPAHAARKVLVERWELEVAALEKAAAAAAATTGDAAEATQVDEAEKAPAGNASGNAKSAKAKGKGKTKADPEVPDTTSLPRPPTEERIARARTGLEAARQALAATAPTIAPAEAARIRVVPFSETRRVATATVRFAVNARVPAEAPGTKMPAVVEQASIVRTHEIAFTDRAHEADAARGIAADPRELPALGRVVEELAAKFADGVEVLEQARATRVQALAEDGRKALDEGEQAKALDLYVQAVFVGGPEVPEELEKVVLARSEAPRLEALLRE